jgi:hypothetical protein
LTKRYIKSFDRKYKDTNALPNIAIYPEDPQDLVPSLYKHAFPDDNGPPLAECVQGGVQFLPSL